MPAMRRRSLLSQGSTKPARASYPPRSLQVLPNTVSGLGTSYKTTTIVGCATRRGYSTRGFYRDGRKWETTSSATRTRLIGRPDEIFERSALLPSWHFSAVQQCPTRVRNARHGGSASTTLN